jgi:hypothetical protein
MQVFSIAPGGLKALWVLVPVALVVIVALVVPVASLLGARTARFEISPDGLRLRGDLYGRLIAVADLRGGAARRVDFAREPALRPRTRTLGTGLPGYQAGWFRLRSGEKALLYLTDRSRAVYVPTNVGYSVLLSPEDPDGFLRALRAVNDYP